MRFRCFAIDHGFTLIELLVVITLLSLCTAIGWVSLDSLGSGARLRGAVSQHASVVRLAQVQASASGEPRRLEYANQTILLRKPQWHAGAWGWDQGVAFALPDPVAWGGMVDRRVGDFTKQPTLMVLPHRPLLQHAVLFFEKERFALALFSNLEEPQVRLLQGQASFSSWEDVVRAFEDGDE